MNRVLLLRHGETALNRSGAFRGLLDVPLSSHGEEEARRLAARVMGEYRLSGLCASPLLRARQTAEPLGLLAGLSVEVDDRFRDLDYGPWAGREPASLSEREQEELRGWARTPERGLLGAEDPAAVQSRALFALVERARASEDAIAIVTHDAVLQLILCELLGLELRSYRGLTLHTASLTELDRVGHGLHVRLIDSTWHLSDRERAHFWLTTA